MAVEGVDRERAVGQDAVEMVAGEGLADQLVGCLARIDQPVVRVIRRPGAHDLGQRLDALNAVDRQGLQRGAAREDVQVRFDEAGQDAGAGRVDDTGAGAAQGHGFRTAADRDDAVAAHGHGLGARPPRVHGQDAGIGDDEIGAHFCSSVQIRVMIWLTSGGQVSMNTPLWPSGRISSGASCMSAGMNCSLPLMPLA